MSALRGISIAQRRSSPVFIVGDGRSGSSLLARTLELHPLFRPREVAHHETKIFSYVNASHTLRPEKWTGAFDYMCGDDRVFRQFLNSIKGIRALHRRADCRLVKSISNRSLLFWALFQNHIVVRSFFHHAAVARQCPRIVEKTPGHLQHLRHIKAAYPESRLIQIFRHPVDVYSSYRKVVENIGRNTWADIGVQDFCREYQSRTAIALAWERRHDFLRIRYESFVDNPREEWKRVCRFLEVEYSDEAVAIEFNPDRHDSFEKHIRGPISRKTKDWQRYLDAEEARSLEETLSGLMLRLKYDRYT
jgi:hypothetical protein